jgi:CMP-N,N'-diacetyllegionaminic acid synthase
LYKNKKILALIPARSGSKRIKNKNLKLLCGKPLVYYSIKYALDNQSLIDRIFVSTDSRKISNYSNKISKNISPVLRPSKLSRDNSSDLGYVVHALDYLKKKENAFDFVIILRPTTPFRQKKLIRNCIQKLLSTKSSSIRSAKKIDHTHPYWMYNIKKNKLIEVINGKNFFKYYQSQKLPKFYMHDGHCDIFDVKNLKNKSIYNQPLKKIYGNNMIYYKNNTNYSINIDNPVDFELAKLIYKVFKR